MAFLSVIPYAILFSLPGQAVGLLAYRLLRTTNRLRATVAGICIPALVFFLGSSSYYRWLMAQPVGPIPLADGFWRLIVLVFTIAGPVGNLVFGALTYGRQYYRGGGRT